MFTDGVPDEWQEALEQAKQMEKEVIMNAYTSGEHQQGFEQEAEQYYNETFKAKEKWAEDTGTTYSLDLRMWSMI